MMTERSKALEELNLETEYYALHTRKQYFSQVHDYLDFVGKNRDWRERDILRNYTIKLRKQGKSQSHINYVVRGPIGALFRAHGLRIPIKLPKVQPAVYNPDEGMFFDPDDIEKLIAVAKSNSGLTVQHKAILAISTIYAPRASEIIRIEQKHLHPKKKTIIIRTVKANLVRQHLIPEAIEPILFAYDYPTISDAKLYDLFYTLIAKAGIERKRRQSFHSIRHTLFHELSYSGFTDEEVYDFTGWRKGGTLGSYIRPLAFKPHNDEKIFEKHPFLPFWE